MLMFKAKTAVYIFEIETCDNTFDYTFNCKFDLKKLFQFTKKLSKFFINFFEKIQ